MSTTIRETYQLQGMSCASCAGRVEKAVKKLDGVLEASVNLANQTANLTVNKPLQEKALVDAFQKIGYPAVTRDIGLTISGMSCASCVAKIEKALQQRPGILSVAVNLAAQTARVQYWEGRTTPQEIASFVTHFGYPAELEGSLQAEGITTEREKETDQLFRRLLLAATLAAPVFLIEMSSHFIPGARAFFASLFSKETSHLIQFALTSMVLFGPGMVFYKKGYPALFKAIPDMNSLVALGTSAAFGYSTVVTFAPDLLPESSRQVYFEAAAVIVVLILLGRFLEARAKGHTGDAIKKLIGLQPKTARIQTEAGLKTIAVESLERDMFVEVRPGERVAVDGIVIEGNSYIDESMITGEPVPVEKRQDSIVTGGTINGAGALTIRATQTGADTVLAQIIKMVQDAQGSKLPIQGLVDKITSWFVPAVLLLSLVTFLVWLVFGPEPALSLALVASVAVLIIACPCAMGLATPTSIMVGTGRAAELGVLFRKGDALQSLQETRMIALDKTGTLTKGKPELTDFHVVDGQKRDEILGLIASVETKSEHPIANAIVAAATEQQLQLKAVSQFKVFPGFGIEGNVDGRQLSVGADRHLAEQSIDLSHFEVEASLLAKQGKTPLYAAVNGELVALIAVSDPIKDTTPAAIKALHAQGLKVAMITGDNKATAQVIASTLGIDHVVAEVLPDGKVDAINALKQTYKQVTFVGDGINDAPALATADVGIAIGTGTDVAIESADIVLMSGDLNGVVNAIGISKRTMQNIRQNLFWAFGYNILLIPVAAGLLYPLNGMLLSPMLAAGAMALSSVFVLSNALRLRWMKPSITTKKPAL